MYVCFVCRVVLQFTGAAIRSERLKVNDLASFIADSKDTLSVQVAEVSGSKRYVHSYLICTIIEKCSRLGHV